jgi:hypothetical protein
MYRIFKIKVNCVLIKLRTTKALYWAHLNYYMYNYGKSTFLCGTFGAESRENLPRYQDLAEVHKRFWL